MRLYRIKNPLIYFTDFTTASNASGLFMARSANALRLMAIPFSLSLHAVLPYTCINTHNPQRSEISFLCPAVGIGITQPLFPGVLCNCPYIRTGKEISLGLFKDLFSPLS
jgi:hypothetical protein